MSSITITNADTKETCLVTRNARVRHPSWVHEQFGSSSEADLQQGLDQYVESDFYDDQGNHLGPDALGVALFREHALRILATQGSAFAVILECPDQDESLGEIASDGEALCGTGRPQDETLIASARAAFQSRLEGLGDLPVRVER